MLAKSLLIQSKAGTLRGPKNCTLLQAGSVCVSQHLAAPRTKHTPQSGIHSKKKIGGARGRDAGIGDEGQDVFGASRIHCFLKNASRSSVHESGATPSLTTSRHLQSTPQISLCRPCDAPFFEAIF